MSQRTIPYSFPKGELKVFVSDMKQVIGTLFDGNVCLNRHSEVSFQCKSLLKDIFSSIIYQMYLQSQKYPISAKQVVICNNTSFLCYLEKNTICFELQNPTNTASIFPVEDEVNFFFRLVLETEKQ